MSVKSHILAIYRSSYRTLTRWILGQRIRARHPSLICDPTAIWDYGYRDIDFIRLGREVSVGPFAEVLMHRKSPFSSVLGELILEDGVVIGAGTNVRASGGAIRVGAGSAITQNCVVVAVNHRILPGVPRLRTQWDEERTGVEIGRNVWIGANSVVLPGTSIGDNAVIAAGSVVRGQIPADELWGGVPARKIRALERAVPTATSA